MKKYSYYTFIVLSLVMFIFSTEKAFSSSGDGFVKRQKSFVKKLLVSENYYECISETERLLKYGNFSTGEIDNYNYFMNSCFYMGGQYKTTVFRIMKYCDPRSFKTGLLLSRSYLKLGMYPRGKKAVMKINKEGLGNNEKSLLLMYKIDSFLYLKEYDSAEALIKNDVSDNELSIPKNELITDLIKYRDIPCRSPVLAGIFSAAVPGAGQAWSGRYADALISLAGVAVTAAASVFFYRKNDRGLCITFGVFSGLFYAGNIWSAWNSAESFNRKSDERFAEDFRRKYIPEYKPLDHIDSRGLFD